MLIGSNVESRNKIDIGRVDCVEEIRKKLNGMSMLWEEFDNNLDYQGNGNVG